MEKFQTLLLEVQKIDKNGGWCYKRKKAVTNYKTLEVFENNKTPTLSLLNVN